MSAYDKQIGGSHYKHFKIQPIEFIVANNLEYRVANVIKYICRYQHKNGIEDLRKAEHYLEMLIEEKTKDQGIHVTEITAVDFKDHDYPMLFEDYSVDAETD